MPAGFVRGDGRWREADGALGKVVGGQAVDGQDWTGRGDWGGLTQGDHPGIPISLRRVQGRARVWEPALSGFSGWTAHWGLRMMFGAPEGQCTKVWEPALSAHGGWCTQGAVDGQVCQIFYSTKVLKAIDYTHKT